MRAQFLYILIILFFSVKLTGQVSYGGKPYPVMERKVSKGIERMPLFDYSWVLSEMESDEKREGRKTLPVAWNYEVNYDPYNSGYWQEMNDGTRVWRMEIFSENAFAVSVFFEEFMLLPGARVFLFDPLQQEILGSFDHRSNKPSGSFPVAHISGDRLVVELQVDKGIKGFGDLRIGSVSHAFADIFGGPDKKDGYFGRSGGCNVDINCPSGDDWQSVKRAVCRIIFKRGTSGTSELCTGTLINNTSRDQTAYLFTANHCIDKDFPAQSAVFYFGYESPNCNGFDGMTNKTIAGSSLLSTSDSLDFSLLLLSEDIPDSYNPYYSGWSLSSNPSTSSVSIHHPLGDVKKIATDTDPVSGFPQAVNPPSWLKESITNGFWRVERWEEGTTEGGSSGSPLFNPNKQLVGNLTGGDATCTNPVNDYFSKFHLCWDYYPDSVKQVKYWLDRQSLGLSAMGGLDPYYYFDSTKTIMEIINEIDELNTFNSFLLNSNQQFVLSGQGPFTVFAPVEDAFSGLSDNTLRFLLEEPSEKLTDIAGYQIVNNKLKFSDLYDGLLLTTLSDYNIRVTEKEEGIFVDNARISIPDIVASNGIIHLTDAFLFPSGTSPDPLGIFPNPASGELYISSKEMSLKGSRVQLFSLNGSLIEEYIIRDESFTPINISHLQTGVYLVKIIADRIIFVDKLVITRSLLP